MKVSLNIIKLHTNDTLPLTCSRTGTCCHGKQVLINPWELVSLARAKKMAPRQFRDQYCEFGGIRLRFDGHNGWKGQKACSQFVENAGCSVHLGRPLSCRLYPLGRQIQSEQVNYIYEGSEFPCLEGCPEVVGLPYLSIGEYLVGQKVEKFEKAQDLYLEMMQNIADIAFVLLLETGLAQSGDTTTLPLWRKIGNEHPQVLADRIGAEWIDNLMLPEIRDCYEDPILYTQKHLELLRLKAQEDFGTLQSNQEFQEASALIMAVALHLARSIGANPKIMVEHWIDTAKKYGAKELI